MGNFTTDKVDKRMAESIDFMVERVRNSDNLFIYSTFDRQVKSFP